MGRLTSARPSEPDVTATTQKPAGSRSRRPSSGGAGGGWLAPGASASEADLDRSAAAPARPPSAASSSSAAQSASASRGASSFAASRSSSARMSRLTCLVAGVY